MTTPATDREGIILNIEESLLGIQVSGGFLSDVRTVELEWKAYDEVIQAGIPMPYICFFPTKGGGAPPVYEPFGARREFLDITVVAHTGATTAAEKVREISMLEVDIHDAMVGVGDGSRGDPTRGGFAVDTIKILPEETDEGVPDIPDRIDGSVTMTATYRVTYEPGDC